jgi:hypothetical protein
MKKATIWANSDGLAVGFGPRDTETVEVTKVSLGGNRQQLVCRIRLSELADTITANHLINAAYIPAGSLLETVRLHVETAATGVNAVLDIGLAKLSDGTDIDDDGVDAAIATATLVDKYTTLCDGALVGTELTYDSKIYASYDTAAFTAGVVVLTAEYICKPV